MSELVYSERNSRKLLACIPFTYTSSKTGSNIFGLFKITFQYWILRLDPCPKSLIQSKIKFGPIEILSRSYSLYFLRRPQKLSKSSPSFWHLLHNVKLTVKIWSIFVAFLENTIFKNRSVFLPDLLLNGDSGCGWWELEVIWWCIESPRSLFLGFRYWASSELSRHCTVGGAAISQKKK